MSTSRDDFGIVIRSALLQRGAKQKFSLFVLILISTVIFTVDNINIKPAKILRSILNDGIYRVSAISSSPINFTVATKDFFVEHMFVYKENNRLKLELEQLKKGEFKSSYLEAENKKLQQFAEINKKSEFTTIGAKILLDKNSPFLNSAIINKGRNSGIKLGMPVLSNGYLVGKIVEVNFVSSRILLLNDLNSRIPVVITPSGDQAILSGVGKKNPGLEYLPENFEFLDDNKVYTSGKDGTLYSGIPVGEAFVENKRISVKLFADPNQIYFVGVVLEKATDTEAM